MSMNAARECTFSFSTKGLRTKKKYEGDFTVKTVLTNGEQMESAIRADQYNAGSSTLAPAFAGFNRAVAELEVRIVTRDGKQLAPGWWQDSDSGRTLLDANIITELYKRAREEGDKAFDKHLDEQIAVAEKSEKHEKSEKK